MEKTLTVALNNFSSIPPLLRLPLTYPVARDELKINLASLYHHYYLDKHDQAPPNPDPAQFEYLPFILNSGDFRLVNDGIGASTNAKRTASSELGQAFCRWFLHDYLGITFFAHMNKVLDKNPHPYFGGLCLKRLCRGDTPDYLCAGSESSAFVAEAKGSYDGINFTNAKFDTWRDQFSRVALVDGSGSQISLKGYIVATQFATEAKPRSKSRILAEDPSTPGEPPKGFERNFGAFIAAQHYGNIAAKLRQPVLSSALNEGFLVQNEISFPAAVWEINGPPAMRGKRFVGGYFPMAGGENLFPVVDGKFTRLVKDFLRLDIGTGTFFGVEETVFRTMASMARRGMNEFYPFDPFREVAPFYSGISFLRDGSIIGPVEFFTPLDVITY